MNDCIFCKIISGELPARKIYEDDNLLAILDIKPVNPGHLLLFPKKHVTVIEEADEFTLGELGKAFLKVGKMLKENFGAVAYNLSENNGVLAGQAVPHLHFHFIPRLEGDNLKLWPQREYEPGEADAVYQKLIN